MIRMTLLPPSLLRWQATDAGTTSYEHVVYEPQLGLVLQPEAVMGSVTSCRLPAATTRAVPSWRVDTPPDTWIEVLVRAEVDADGAPRWTRWYNLGVWSLDAAHRYSVEQQADEDAEVATDTLLLRRTAQALQWRVVLHGGSQRSPVLRSFALAVEPSPEGHQEAPTLTAVEPLPVPQLSQMVYPNGGRVWCSPTALTMLLGYWYKRTQAPGLAPFADPRAVPELVAPAVYDSVYDGTGNWPFNTAFAATFGLEAYVLQLSGLPDVQRLLQAGVPLTLSIAWQPGMLEGAPVGHSNGHLIVVVGLTEAGDVVVNDPAADPRQGTAVRRVYPRAQLQAAWEHSARSAYLVYPVGWLG